jgi:hypothetical protein
MTDRDASAGKGRILIDRLLVLRSVNNFADAFKFGED